jgi:NAD(P) transhydrogenase subunit alpha
VTEGAVARRSAAGAWCALDRADPAANADSGRDRGMTLPGIRHGARPVAANRVGTARRPTCAIVHRHMASTDFWSMLFVFMLATFVGLQVIQNVSRLLHTPLMSLTNAISAIAVVESIAITGADYPTPIRILGLIAVFASVTNIVSGFLITDRMLKMFKTTRQGDRQ